jgi:hypothetical protein
MEMVLLNFGILGFFCIFSAYQNYVIQKQLDKLSKEWASNLENAEKARAAAERLIVTRYDSVLIRYEATRENIYKEVIEVLGKNKESLELLSQKVDSLQRTVLGLPKDQVV